MLEARELIQRGELDKARELLNQAVTQEPDNVGLLIFRADFLEHQQYREAIKDCDAIVKLASRTAVAYYYRALAKVNLKESQTEIEADLRKAVDCDPHYSNALVWLSDLVTSRDPNEALKLLYQSVPEGLWFNDAPYVYLRVASLQGTLGRYKASAEAARLAIALKSDVLGFYQPLADAERGLGKSEKDARIEVANFCRTQAEARSALGQKWNAVNTYWTGFQFLAGASPGTDAADVVPNMVPIVSAISGILESIGSKEQAIVFWNMALKTDLFKAYAQALQEENLKSLSLRERVIVFWKTVIKTDHFKAYNQIFTNEINRLSAPGVPSQ